MSQRRTAAAAKAGGGAAALSAKLPEPSVVLVEEETIPPSSENEKAPFIVDKGGPVMMGSFSLETESAGTASAAASDNNDDGVGGDRDGAPANAEERYQIERHHRRIRHWRESPFAVGLVEPTWKDEWAEAFSQQSKYGDDDMNPDETGCLWFSGLVCSLLGADRVGNLAVLRSSHEWVEEIEEDEETGERVSRRHTRPKLDVVVGPYWPMMAFCTYPLIFGVSGWAFVTKILPGNTHPLVVIVWTTLTVGLILALAFTACRDPGILYKYEKPPPQDDALWRWTDRAHSYRPRTSFYDSDTAIVVEEFDHT